MRQGMIAIVVSLFVSAGVAMAQDGAGRAAVTDDLAVRRVVDDYVGLYRKDTLTQWKALFVPGFTATYTNDDGSVTTRTLDDFYERQRAGFEKGEMHETLHNVRIQRVGKLAYAFADFRFSSGNNAPRPGQLMLLLIEDRGQFKIAALTFTYHLK
jgi:hypothetical protein